MLRVVVIDEDVSPNPEEGYWEDAETYDVLTHAEHAELMREAIEKAEAATWPRWEFGW